MRIGLVIPPTGFMLDDRVFPSLGILKVAAVLEQAGHAVHVFDGSGMTDYVDAVAAWAARLSFRHVGFTATTPQMPAAWRMTEAVRLARGGEVTTVLGGPHVTLLNAAARRELQCGESGRATAALRDLQGRYDVLVAGDGERAIFQALEVDEGPVLIDADDPSIPLFLTREALSMAPFPARHLIDLQSYRFEIAGERAVSLIGQLGCPFECGFCGGRLSPSLRRVRLRPPEAVVAEMRHLYETYGARGFMFLDDELNVNRALPDLLARITALQRELGVRFRCRGLLKAELFTDAQAAALAEAGFADLLIGFESGSPRMLLNMNKKATLEENTRCVATARAHGIRVKALMSVGHPGESAATVQETEDWLLAVRPDEFDVTVITLYPGTPYYDQSQCIASAAYPIYVYEAPKTRDRLYSVPIDQFEDTPFYKGVPGQYRAYVWTDHLTSDDLCRLRDRVEATVRERLGIAWPTGPAAIQFEHSMGQR